jgi:hypothetical protein
VKKETVNLSPSSESTEKTKGNLMRTILLPIVGAVLLLAAFSSCSTTVRTDDGHAVTTGVHAH